jgi:hypothetical protein
MVGADNYLVDLSAPSADTHDGPAHDELGGLVFEMQLPLAFDA